MKEKDSMGSSECSTWKMNYFLWLDERWKYVAKRALFLRSEKCKITISCKASKWLKSYHISEISGGQRKYCASQCLILKSIHITWKNFTTPARAAVPRSRFCVLFFAIGAQIATESFNVLFHRDVGGSLSWFPEMIAIRYLYLQSMRLSDRHCRLLCL